MQLDVDATRANDIDGVGGFESGYDDIFNEPRVGGEEQVRTTARVETQVRFKVQVEPEQNDMSQMLAGGSQMARRFSLIAFVPELRTLGLMNEDGTSKIKQGDRVHQLRHVLTYAVITTFTDPPGLYVTEVRPLSYGFPSMDQNLLQIICTDRKQGGT